MAICVICGECENYRVDLNWNASLKSVDNRQIAAATPVRTDRCCSSE